MREVNLEAGMPAAGAAVKRLTFELHNTRHLGAVSLKIIHGYGSSGKGGKIRTEVRSYLERLQRRGEVRLVIPGERFSIFDADTRAAFLIDGELRGDRDLDRHNNGVTFVVV
jgi:hypothetical protein